MSVSVWWTHSFLVNSDDCSRRNWTDAIEVKESGKCHFQLRREKVWNRSHCSRLRVDLPLIIWSFHCFDEGSILKNWQSLWPSSEWIRILVMVCNCRTRFFDLCLEWTNCTWASREQESRGRVISFSRPTTWFSAVSSEDNLDQSVHTSMPLQSGTFESSLKASLFWEGCKYSTACHKKARTEWSHSLDCVLLTSATPMWTILRGEGEVRDSCPLIRSESSEVCDGSISVWLPMLSAGMDSVSISFVPVTDALMCRCSRAWGFRNFHRTSTDQESWESTVFPLLKGGEWRMDVRSLVFHSNKCFWRQRRQQRSLLPVDSFVGQGDVCESSKKHFEDEEEHRERERTNLWFVVMLETLEEIRFLQRAIRRDLQQWRWSKRKDFSSSSSSSAWRVDCCSSPDERVAYSSTCPFLCLLEFDCLELIVDDWNREIFTAQFPQDNRNVFIALRNDRCTNRISFDHAYEQTNDKAIRSAKKKKERADRWIDVLLRERNPSSAMFHWWTSEVCPLFFLCTEQIRSGRTMSESSSSSCWLTRTKIDSLCKGQRCFCALLSRWICCSDRHCPVPPLFAEETQRRRKVHFDWH